MSAVSMRGAPLRRALADRARAAARRAHRRPALRRPTRWRARTQSPPPARVVGEARQERVGVANPVARPRAGSPSRSLCSTAKKLEARIATSSSFDASAASTASSRYCRRGRAARRSCRPGGRAPMRRLRFERAVAELLWPARAAGPRSPSRRCNAPPTASADSLAALSRSAATSVRLAGSSGGLMTARNIATSAHRSSAGSALAAPIALSTMLLSAVASTSPSARTPASRSSRQLMRRSSTSVDCSPRTCVASQVSWYIAIQRATYCVDEAPTAARTASARSCFRSPGTRARSRPAAVGPQAAAARSGPPRTKSGRPT